MKEVIDYISTINTRIVFSNVILFCVIAFWMFKNKPEGKFVFGFLRWVFVSYGIIATTKFFNEIALYNSEFDLFEFRLIMWVLSWSLPLSLVFSKLGRSYKYILFVSIFIQFQMSFNRFIIIITSFHRDYIFNTSQDSGNLPFIVSTVFIALELVAAISILILVGKAAIKSLKPA